MRKIHISLVALVLCLSGIIFSSSAEISIAVNSFDARGVDEHEAELIASRIRSRLVGSEKFRLLERTEMETILKEQGFQKSGSCNEKSCAVEIGQILGVQKMVSGSVGKIGRMYTIAIRVIDVTTGQIEFSVEENCRCSIEEVFTKSSGVLADKLIYYYKNPSATLPQEDNTDNSRRAKIIRQIAIGTVSVGLLVGGVVVENKVRATNNDISAA
ncbi:MAG: CsgG/HfaB family protein, partial [Chitinispirillaceae bacterium]